MPLKIAQAFSGGMIRMALLSPPLIGGWRKELWFYRVGVMACLCRSVDVWFVEFFIEKTGQAFCVNQRAILWFL